MTKSDKGWRMWKEGILGLGFSHLWLHSDSPEVPWTASLALSSVERCVKMAKTCSFELEQIKLLLGAVANWDQVLSFSLFFILFSYFYTGFQNGVLADLEFPI